MNSIALAERQLERAIQLSKADSISVAIQGGDQFDLRFAVNTVTTCGAARGLNIHISSHFGTKSASANTNDFSDEGIAAAVKSSEELARLAPDNPEFMPPLGSETTYLPVEAYDEQTAHFSPADATERVMNCLRRSRDRKIELAGFLSVTNGFVLVGTSNGLRGLHRMTQASYSTTARTYDGRGSNKVLLSSQRMHDLNLEQLSAQAIERAFTARNPKDLPPGKYPTILEPSAFADILGFFFMHLNRRLADEGRSFFSEPGGKSKLGHVMSPPTISVRSNPQHALVPSAPWGSEYLPQQDSLWIDSGKLSQMVTERFWAQKTGSTARPFPGNLIMEGQGKSLNDLIASTERGILVTNLWYIRDVDPQKLLITGLTRDGLFWIEDGKISHPIKNFRFNESPAEVLRNILDSGVAQRAVGNEVEGVKFHVPPVKLSSFNFSTVSDAV